MFKKLHFSQFILNVNKLPLFSVHYFAMIFLKRSHSEREEGGEQREEGGEQREEGGEQREEGGEQREEGGEQR